MAVKPRPGLPVGRRRLPRRVIPGTPVPLPHQQNFHHACRPFRSALPRNVKVLGLADLLNDIASEMIFPLLPGFLLTVLLGNRFSLGVIEGRADSVASLLKLWSGSRSDQAGRR